MIEFILYAFFVIGIEATIRETNDIPSPPAIVAEDGRPRP